MPECDQNPKVKPALQFFPVRDGLYHVYDPESSRHFQMGETEVGWLRLVDGTRSEADFREIIPEQYYEAFFSNLDSMGLMDGATAAAKFNIFKLQFALAYPVKTLSNIGGFSVLYRRTINAATPFLLGINVILFAALWKDLAQAAFTVHLSPYKQLIAYFIAIMLTSLIHESSHALMARSYGVAVTAAGMMLYFLNPMFYVDVSGIGALQSKSQRVCVMLGGVMSNNALVTLSLLSFVMFRQYSFSVYLVYFALMNTGLALSNMIPFIEFDGYYVFREVLGESEFCENAMGSLRGDGIRSFEYSAYAALHCAFSYCMILLASIAARKYILLHVLSEGYANRLTNISAAAFFIALSNHFLATLRSRQENAHTGPENTTDLWIYRSFVVLLLAACSAFKEAWNMPFAGIISLLAVIATIPMLIRICSEKMEEVCRQLFNISFIYVLFRMASYWFLQRRDMVIRVTDEPDLRYRFAQSACLFTLFAAVTITLVFYLMVISSYAFDRCARRNRTNARQSPESFCRQQGEE